MSKPAAKKVPKKKTANGYLFPERLPEGFIFTDNTLKKQWKLGPPIGKGGFGEIYSACEIDGKLKEKYIYAVKVEPKGNGPLFVEMHFLLKNAKPSDIASWKKEKKLTHLGMPQYVTSGTFQFNELDYRFVILERFGESLHNLFLKSKNGFPPETVFRIADQILNVLEYVHSRGYIHADIKGENILVGLDPKLKNQTYLLDYGLACKYTTEEYRFNPKYAHNGTLQYTSRDAHDGVHTRRGDLEILAYNMLQWLGNDLPWEIGPVKIVQTKKDEFMNNLTTFFDTRYKNCSIPSALIKFFQYIKSMKYDSIPDYKKCHQLFSQGVKESGGSDKGELKFTSVENSSSKAMNGIGEVKKTPKSAGVKASKSASKENISKTPVKRAVNAAKKPLAKKSTPKIEEAKAVKQSKKLTADSEEKQALRKSPRHVKKTLKM